MEKIETTPKKSRWGTGIFMLYGGFVLFMVACVIFASFQSFDLVEPDYYEKGLAFQDEIDKTVRTGNLSQNPLVTYNANDKNIMIAFPPECAGDSLSGSIYLYRPSNSRWDKKVSINTNDDNRQHIPAESLVAGLWMVRIDWIWLGQSYYYESRLLISGGE